ncbi:SET and MYND domain-containing protein 4-like [Anopheles funestus]|uniref:SET and MYND domain-containing protein 4-like n=1 Tax=Anopheles funestus TaxID=62324 RepID=UPI0020C5F8FA|nr:SET and MYND domain-containing protein 4-like [Anopheles funestus]
MEQLNQLIAYCEPNSYVLKVAYLGRALMAYKSEEDFYCMYNIWDAEEIDAILNFPNESAKREFDELYDRAHSRRLGNRYPSPYNDRSNCINYVVCNNSPRYGRYLHGKWNVMKGNLVLRELPFVRLLLSGDRWMRCHHCLIYAPLVLIPCRGCSIMLYCSKSCRDRAKQEYHSFECPIIFMLLSQYTPIEVLALRSTICAYKKFYEMPSVLENFIRSVCMSEKWVHQYCNPNGRYKNPEDAYGKVYQLATNRSRLTREKLTIDGLRGVALAKLLVRANNIPTSNVKLLAELTVRHMHILRVNALVLHCSLDAEP